MFFRPATFQLSTGAASPWQQSSVPVTLQLTSLNLTPLSLINSPHVCLLQGLVRLCPHPTLRHRCLTIWFLVEGCYLGEVWEVWPSRGNRSLETGFESSMWLSALGSFSASCFWFTRWTLDILLQPASCCYVPHRDRLFAFFHNPNLFHKPKQIPLSINYLGHCILQ